MPADVDIGRPASQRDPAADAGRLAAEAYDCANTTSSMSSGSIPLRFDYSLHDSGTELLRPATGLRDLPNAPTAVRTGVQ
jgi:hypothetical protein